MSELWYKDAVFYELNIRAFMDSNNDGHGDIKGLISKLDYLKDLGIDCIWLLPIYPSPGRDDGYDIKDFYNINPDYGTLDDFKELIKQAHDRDLRVIADLVLNHISDEHPWFIEGRSNPDSPYHDYFVWSDDPAKYPEARIIFIDTEISNWTWCNQAGKYYWHRFFSHQPDLNFHNKEVQNEIKNVIKFWLDLGLDGFRADAVPYLFEREGTNCENLPETHVYLKELRKFIDENYEDKILLAEANQWPEDLGPYFGNGDEFHMAFHFPLMPRMFMAIKRENNSAIIDIIKRTPEIPANCQWTTFLRNHDELTLEMCTDEERDYMYNEYARDRQMKLNLGIRRRLVPLLDRDFRKIELMYAMLLALPGSPIIYYGDEIGMGDNIYLGDRAGVRTPMQWNEDRNAGFSKCKPSKLYAPVITDPDYNYNAVNVESQQNLPSSMFNWLKDMIVIRKKYKILSRGDLNFLHSNNRRVLSFYLEYENEYMLCVFNLAATDQPVKIDLKQFQGYKPLEIFGQTELPKIGKSAYFLMLARYGYYVFYLIKNKAET
ncbi:MAG: maltose alpha-D-glucosyltransferase [Spirochaetes bacterium]|nr:maltose alpha-D-glucosyltransferase [Spirochaetota bacterium]